MSRAKISVEDIPEELLFFSRTNKFLNVYLVKQAGKSDYTRKSYKSSLLAFFDYVAGVRNVSPMKFLFSDCNYDFVLEYSQYMQNELHLKRSTINCHIATIRSYLEYASDCDVSVMSSYISVRKVPLLAVPKVRKPIIEAADMPKFLDSPAHTHIGDRDRFILILLFDSAIRVSELVGITLGDLIMESSRCTVLIHGKGRKERCIMLSETASEHLREYVRAYHGDCVEKTAPLLYTVIHDIRQPMSVRNVQRILKKYGDITREQVPTIPDTVSPHTLRRSRATLMYQDGVPIEQVAAALGHAQTETTRTHYAVPSIEQMREIVERGSKIEPAQEKEWIGNLDEIKKKFGLK